MASPRHDERPRHDVAIAGGGLAGTLIALALAEKRPELDIVLVEGGTTLGGDHVWSFFGSDVAPADRWLVEPLVSARWAENEVRFPGYTRGLPGDYNSIFSERLDAVASERLGSRIRRGVAVTAVHADGLVLADESRIAARGVIDARGAGDLAQLEVGWQKFVGLEIVTDRPHGLDRPVIMDATVDQIDGYRFVYLLPFAPDRVFVEDTYYSDGPALDVAAVEGRVRHYVAAQGWRIAGTGRRETGVLPVAVSGDFEAYWRSSGTGVGKAGVRAGLFHPTTGYSLPDAVRAAMRVAGAKDHSSAGLERLLHDHAAVAWRNRRFYRLLDAMLFRAAGPTERRRVMERFYGLDAGLIARFYAAQSTMMDRARVLIGKPPVPIGRALKAMKGIS